MGFYFQYAINLQHPGNCPATRQGMSVSYNQEEENRYYAKR